MKNKHKTERMNKTKIGSMKKLIYGKMAQKKKDKTQIATIWNEKENHQTQITREYYLQFYIDTFENFR